MNFAYTQMYFHVLGLLDTFLCTTCHVVGDIKYTLYSFLSHQGRVLKNEHRISPRKPLALTRLLGHCDSNKHANVRLVY